MFRKSKASVLFSILVILLLIYAVISLIHTRNEIADTKEEIRTLTQQIADQKEQNTALANSIENSGDPSSLQDVAREKLNLVTPNDRIFYITE